LQERATSSSWQAAFNAINILCGVGLLTTPYAMAISGLSSLLLLIGIGEDCCDHVFRNRFHHIQLHSIYPNLEEGAPLFKHVLLPWMTHQWA
jgi:hypothetical protein